MRTPKQIAASQSNGALSNGPISIQGKLNSSRNSLRHGLLARVVVLAVARSRQPRASGTQKVVMDRQGATSVHRAQAMWAEARVGRFAV